MTPTTRVASSMPLPSIPAQQRRNTSESDQVSPGGLDVLRFACCGVAIAALNTGETVELLRTRAQRNLSTSVHLCNSYTLTLARDRSNLGAVLAADDLNLPDGAPIAWVGRRQGHENLARPTRGPGVMDAVLTDGLHWGARHYFYGSSTKVIERLSEILPLRYPGLRLVGLESPPFRSLTEQEQEATRQRFADSGAHYVWIGLGTPKQDYFVHEFAADVPAVMVAIGAAFDFAAGTQREAPTIFQSLGSEWLFRLAMEPRRLASRYARSAALVPELVRSARA